MKIYEPLDSRNSTGLTQALAHEQCNMDGGGIQVALTATAELHRPLVVSGKERVFAFRCVPTENSTWLRSQVLTQRLNRLN